MDFDSIDTNTITNIEGDKDRANILVDHDRNNDDEKMLQIAKRNNKLINGNVNSNVGGTDESESENESDSDSGYDNPLLYTQGKQPSELFTQFDNTSNRGQNVDSTSVGNVNTLKSNEKFRSTENSSVETTKDINQIAVNANTDDDDNLFLCTQIQGRLDDFNRENNKLQSFEQKLSFFKNTENNNIRNELMTPPNKKNIVKTTKQLKTSQKTTKSKNKNKISKPKTISEYNIINHTKTKELMLSLLSGKKNKLKNLINNKKNGNPSNDILAKVIKSDIKTTQRGIKRDSNIISSGNEEVEEEGENFLTYNKEEWMFVLELLKENNINDSQSEKNLFLHIYGEDEGDRKWDTKGDRDESFNENRMETQIQKTSKINMFDGEIENINGRSNLKPTTVDQSIGGKTVLMSLSQVYDDTVPKNNIQEFADKDAMETPQEAFKTDLEEHVIIMSSQESSLDRLTDLEAQDTGGSEVIVPDTTDEESGGFVLPEKSIPVSDISELEVLHGVSNTQDNPIILESSCSSSKSSPSSSTASSPLSVIDLDGGNKDLGKNDKLSDHYFEEEDEDFEYYYTPLSHIDKMSPLRHNARNSNYSSNTKKPNVLTGEGTPTNTLYTNTNHNNKDTDICCGNINNIESSRLSSANKSRVIPLTQRSFNAVPSLISPIKRTLTDISAKEDTADIIVSNNASVSSSTTSSYWKTKSLQNGKVQIQVPATRTNSILLKPSLHPSLSLTHLDNIARSPTIDFTSDKTVIPESQESSASHDLCMTSSNHAHQIIESPTLNSASMSKSLNNIAINNNNTSVKTWESLSPKDLSEALQKLGIPKAKGKKIKTTCTAINLENNARQNLFYQLSQVSYKNYEEFFDDLRVFISKDEYLLELIYTYQVISFPWFSKYLIDKSSNSDIFTEDDGDENLKIKIMLENIDPALLKKWGDNQGICFGSD